MQNMMNTVRNRSSMRASAATLGCAMTLALFGCAEIEPEDELLSPDEEITEGTGEGIDADLADVQPTADEVLQCPVLVVGGSTAAATAALGALREGALVCLVQPRNVVGGQFTTQALPASDDGPVLKQVGDRFGLSASQQRFRKRQRELQGGSDNPGKCWVAPLCTGPGAAQSALNEQLRPYINSGHLQIVSNATPVEVTFDRSGARPRVTGARFRDTARNVFFSVNAGITVEATDLGDLLELGNIQSRVGQEARSDTGEAILPEAACPMCQQSFTFGVVVEKTAAGRGQTISRPQGYLQDPWMGFYTATRYSQNSDGTMRPVGFMEDFGYFTYRRLTAANANARVGRDASAGDIAVLNVGCQVQHNGGRPGAVACGNDYQGDETTGGSLVGVSREVRERHLEQARNRARGYLYFLQTSAGADLRPASSITGTSDGVAIDPYIREARRGVALTTIRHEDVSKQFFPGRARSRTFVDSIGIGDYHYMDVHPNKAVGHLFGLSGDAVLSLPFTIAAGALVPVNTDGLVLSSKSLGTTHITNAAYRMHPVEWAIGEASGALAARAVAGQVQPRDIVTSEARLRALQGALARAGAPLYWTSDIATDDPDFEAIQVLAAAGVMGGESPSDLRYQPQVPISRALAAFALVKILGWELVNPATPRFSDVPASHWAYGAIETLAARGVIAGFGDGTFKPGDRLTREHFSFMIKNVIGEEATRNAYVGTPIDGVDMQKRELARVLYRAYKTLLGI